MNAYGAMKKKTRASDTFVRSGDTKRREPVLLPLSPLRRLYFQIKVDSDRSVRFEEALRLHACRAATATTDLVEFRRPFCAAQSHLSSRRLFLGTNKSAFD